MSSDNVAALQQQLTELKLYQGPITGQYDDATAEAVSAFQRLMGYGANGVATRSTQEAITDSLASLIETYGDTDHYALVPTTVEEDMAKIATAPNSSLRLRAEPNGTAQILANLKYDTDFSGIGRGGHWQLYQMAGVQVFFSWKTPKN